MKKISAEQFDAFFDEGTEDILQYCDPSSATRPIRASDAPRKVNITMPEWLIEELDSTAKHLAISRQAVAVIWLAEKAEEHRKAG